jgi:hypothetical protein
MKKKTIAAASKKLGKYRFDRSDYVVLKAEVRRDPNSGRLTQEKKSASKR